MASTSKKIALIKKQFPLDKKSVSTSQMKNLLKNALPLYGNVSSTLKNLSNSKKKMKKLVFTIAGICLVFKN